MENTSYQPLYPLNKTNYEIVDGEPDITGWAVINEAGNTIGSVNDLLFDPQSNAVRYLVIKLSHELPSVADKLVMIPIGIAHLHTKEDLIILPNLHLDQFSALPIYIEGEVGPNTEQLVREVIGSPAALRMEETIISFDQQEFYRHHHFDREKFYRKNPNL